MLHLIFKPRSRHRLLHTLLFCSYFNVFAFSLFAPLFTIFALQFGANAFAITSALALYGFVVGILLIVFGRIQNRIVNKRLVIISSYFFLALAASTFLLVQELWQLYIVQVINAAATAWMTPAWKALYGKYEDLGRETEEWALVDGGNQLLLAIATFLGGALVTIIGFHFLILLMVLLQLIGALFSLQLLAPEESA